MPAGAIRAHYASLLTVGFRRAAAGARIYAIIAAADLIVATIHSPTNGIAHLMYADRNALHFSTDP